MVSKRERRATAGKRMEVLTGKALEDDEAFWGHDTWEEEDSGHESFHSSDEESEIKKDYFDSDFDDSESDHEEEEAAAGAAQEQEIAREERARKAVSRQGYSEVARRRIGKRPPKFKRIVGDGMNAGIVLNVPGAAPIVPIAKQAPAPKRPITKKVVPSLASTRSKRSQVAQAAARQCNGKEVKSTKSEEKAKATTKKRKRDTFTQEQLLLEAATVTEPENVRWLLSRKRALEQSERLEKELEGQSSATNKKVMERFSSRRGYLNTITFPEMDHVPSIILPKKPLKPPEPELCAITGKKARYRDPKTGLAYYDLAAFKELRRKYNEKQTKPTLQGQPATPSTAVPAVTNGITSPTNGDCKPAAAMLVPTQPAATPSAPLSPTVEQRPIGEGLSPRRASPRRRKPSARVLEALEVQSTDGLLIPSLPRPEESLKVSSGGVATTTTLQHNHNK